MIKYIIVSIVACILASQTITAQCFPDRHSTNFFDGWISCETAINPNADRGKGHFIMYDFGKVYKLGQMTIWNSNDPSHLDWGMRDVVIDYSLDGEIWNTVGDFTFPQANGLSTYEGTQGPFLNDVEARFLLISGINNYGGECFGLSEVRIGAEEVIISDVDDITLDCVGVSVYPNPFVENMSLVLAPGCSGDLRYVIYDALGHEISAQKSTLTAGRNSTIELGQDLPSGSYMLYIEFGGKSIQKSIIKIGKT